MEIIRGWWARFAEQLEPKLVTTVILGLIGLFTVRQESAAKLEHEHGRFERMRQFAVHASIRAEYANLRTDTLQIKLGKANKRISYMEHKLGIKPREALKWVDTEIPVKPKRGVFGWLHHFFSAPNEGGG